MHYSEYEEKWQIEHWNIEQVIVMAICWTWFCFPLQKLDIYGRLESRDLIRRIRSKVESSNQTPGNEITKKSNPDHQTTNSWTLVTRGHTPHCSTPNHHLEGGKVFQESLDFVSKWPDFPEFQSSSKVHEKFITINHEEHTVSRIIVIWDENRKNQRLKNILWCLMIQYSVGHR